MKQICNGGAGILLQVGGWYLSSGCDVAPANGCILAMLKGAVEPGVRCGEVASKRYEPWPSLAQDIGCPRSGLILPKSSWIKQQREKSVVQALPAQ